MCKNVIIILKIVDNAHDEASRYNLVEVYRLCLAEKKEKGVSSLSKYNFSFSHLQQAHYQGKYLDRMIKKTETGNMLNSALESLQLDLAEKTIRRSSAL